MSKLSTEDLANLLARRIVGMMKAGDIEIPDYFIIPASEIGELIIVAKRIIKERCLSKGLNIAFTETITSLLENSRSMTDDQMDTVILSLNLAEKEDKDHEASNKGWYANI